MAINKNYIIAVSVLLGTIGFSEYQKRYTPKNPDAGLTVAQLIKKFGYPLEIHQITTEDGYILTLHRIPYGRKRNNSQEHIPILFMHGILHSAAEFINLGPENALSFLLADKGFDIWLGNARGTTWSRKHKSLNPDKDKTFWNFSFHEIGYYDLPASVDYILKTTNSKKLHYVGYSQGTSIFFVMASERPEYADKIRLMTALAPAIYVGDPTSPLIKSLVYIRTTLEKIMHIFNLNELFSNDGIVALYLKQICDEHSLFVNICLQHFFMLHGYNEEQVNKTMLSTIFSNLPAGVSSQQIRHLLQIIETGNFEKYDLGKEQNLKKYGQSNPPLYDLSKVTNPVALYYGINDWTIQTKNVEKIMITLPNIVKKYLVPLEKFNHNDFIHAKDAVDLLYNSVIEEIVKH